MKAYIDFSGHDRKRKIVVMNEQGGAYSFVSQEFVPHELGSEIKDECALGLPHEIYEPIAQLIKDDDSVPDKKKDYIEGKLEATEAHLEDMRKLVFEKRKVG